jgi:hypothetical protein
MKINEENLIKMNMCEDGLSKFSQANKDDYDGSPLDLINKIDTGSAADKSWILFREPYMNSVEITQMLCDAADLCLTLIEEDYSQDLRAKEAIEAKRKHIKGEISDEEMSLACSNVYQFHDEIFLEGNRTHDHIVYQKANMVLAAAVAASYNFYSQCEYYQAPYHTFYLVDSCFAQKGKESPCLGLLRDFFEKKQD